MGTPRRLLGVLSICVVAGLLGAGAWSQNPTVVVDHPAGITRLLVETPDIAGGTNGPASRFQLRTVAGDPTTPNDDNRVIASVNAPFGSDQAAFSSITTISIDNLDPNATNPVLADLSTIQAGGGIEFWPLPPTVGIRDILWKMLVPIDDPDPTVATELIEVSQDAVLLRDTVKLDFILTNRGTQSHTVGLRAFIDATFGQSNLDGTSIILSDGTVLDHEASFSAQAGGRIPDGWVSFDNMNTPAVVLRGTITGGEVNDPGMARSSAGPPDAVEFGQRINMGRDNQFNFTPNTSAVIAGNDWGYAVKWNEEPLPPGSSRRYVTYYGLGGSVSDFTPPYVLAAYAPFTLQIVQGDDPITPGVVETEYLGDQNGSSVWDVRACCDNFGSATINDARATIALPAGFELDPASGQGMTVLLGSIPRNVQATALWRVRTTASIHAGIHEIRVIGPLGKSVTRKINIPALPTLPQDNLDPLRGLSMVTVPYNFQITDAEHVFQSLGSLMGSNAALIRWNPSAQLYEYFPSTFVTNIEPGLGYWLVNRLRLPVVFPTDRLPVSTTEPFSIDLVPGWNQIGSPFLSTIRLQDATVVASDGISRSFLEAADAGLILGTRFAYDPVGNDYTYPTTMTDMVMEPDEAYWFLALRPVSLILSPPTLIPFRHQVPTAATAAPTDGWRAELIVKAGGLVRAERLIGQSPKAQDGADPADIMSPPEALASGPRLVAYFPRTDWGLRSGRYLADIRSGRPGPQTWDFVVDTTLHQQNVAISWPDLSGMPANLAATLEDVATGRSCYMRTARSYVYSSGDGGARQFRITLRDRGAATLQITGFASVPTAGGVQMSCRFTSPATADVTVRNLAGRVIKRLWKGRDVSAGEQKIVWTGQAEDGLSAPNGAYVVEINASSAETGERIGIMRVIQYRR